MLRINYTFKADRFVEDIRIWGLGKLNKQKKQVKNF